MVLSVKGYHSILNHIFLKGLDLTKAVEVAPQQRWKISS